MDRIEKLKQFLMKSPGDSFLQHALALEYSKIGDDIAARTLFEEIIKNNPSYTGTYYHLAKLFEREGATEKAIAIYEQGIQIARQSGDLHSMNELRSALQELTL